MIYIQTWQVGVLRFVPFRMDILVLFWLIVVLWLNIPSIAFTWQEQFWCTWNGMCHVLDIWL